jgi:hypothetical protein
MPPRDPDVVRRRHAKGRVAHGVFCAVFAGGITVVIASQASTVSDAQLGSLLALVAAVALVPGIVLAMVNLLALRAGQALEGPRAAAAAAGGVAFGLLVAVAAVAVASSAGDPLALAAMAAIAPGYELVLASATVAALR